MMDRRRAVVELGVDEAYRILAGLPGGDSLPPLAAIENEDWGRDFLLSRFGDLPSEALERLGLVWDESEIDTGPGAA